MSRGVWAVTLGQELALFLVTLPVAVLLLLGVMVGGAELWLWLQERRKDT